MFATGNSQFDFLDALVLDDSIDWTHVIGFHMDEYVGLDADHPASFRRYLRERLVERVPIAEFHFIEGDAPDAGAECERYAALLREHPLDLCCLGIGENGHLAFNDPPVADFDDPLDVKVVELDEACRQQQVGEGHFPDVGCGADARHHGHDPRIAAGVDRARDRARGAQAEPVRRALVGPIETACPASILRTQPHATLYLDRVRERLGSEAQLDFFDGTEGRGPVR